MKQSTGAVVAAAERDYEAHRAEMIFAGSDGDATRALYNELAGCGPLGFVAIQLFRAQKCSARAKVYHRGHYSTLAYGRKNWSLEQLTTLLMTTNAQGDVWGCGHPDPTARDPWVLRIVLPLPQGPVTVTTTHALPYPWGWGVDAANERYPWVLYVDLPHGQVSFHAVTRGLGPDYAGAWDGIVDASTGRILRFVNTVLAVPSPPLTLVPALAETSHEPDHEARSTRGRRPQRRVLRTKRSR